MSNAGRVQAAVRDRLANGVLVKPNQAGIISETLAAVNAARAGGMATIVSARSRESEDVTIARAGLAQMHH